MATPHHPPIKHWRAFGPEEWSHVREGALGLLLGSLLPVALFYVSYQTWGFFTAVGVVLVWATAVFVWHWRRTGGPDVFSATTFVFACIKATAGVASNNQWLYLAWPSLENMIYGSAFLGSAVLGTPLLTLYAQRLYPIPDTVRATPTFRQAFIVASAAWFCGHSLRALVRLALLATLWPDNLGLYLIADTVAGWPINISLVAFTTWYPLRRLHQAGFMTVQPAPRSSLDAVEMAVEEAAPGTI
jgi:intracellular septation protein A